MMKGTKSAKAEIICVGTELLLGQIVNTNAAWLSGQLSLAGVYVYYQTVVGDNPDRLKQVLRTAVSRSDYIFLTGGLGPTQDDITMACTAEVAGVPLQLHQPSKDAIAAYFAKMNRTHITENNWKQALLPETCQPLPNHHGTAPGCIISMKTMQDDCHFVLLPGPPAEMQPMFHDFVLPWLTGQITSRLKHVFVRMAGIGESAAETLLRDLIDQQQNPTLAPYASTGEVIFRITQSLSNTEDEDLIQPLLEEIKKRAGPYIYEIGRRTLPEVVRDLLSAAGQTISFAESCTGGLIAKQLTDYPNASHVFAGGLVAYQNTIKRDVLGVDSGIFERDGAVSEKCAVAMASGCLKLFKSDWAVAVTGIAGPDGGTVEKPVGTVFLAVAGHGHTQTESLKLVGNRERIRTLAALNAYRLIRRVMNESAI